MNLADSVGDVLAGRALQLVGVLFGCAAATHFVLWANAPTQEFDAAVATGDLATAVPAVLGYAQSHPAYVLAFLAAVLLLARRP